MKKLFNLFVKRPNAWIDKRYPEIRFILILIILFCGFLISFLFGLIWLIIMIYWRAYGLYFNRKDYEKN